MARAASNLFGPTCAAAARRAVALPVAVLISTIYPADIAAATTGNVVFQGTIDTNSLCSVTVRQNGRFGLSADFRTMSSKIPGGLAGVADIFAIGLYNISATTFPLFTQAPVGGNTNTVFEPRFSGASLLLGANFAERLGTSPVALPFGISNTRVTVHLIATRTGSAFPSGTYRGTVVVRCE